MGIIQLMPKLNFSLKVTVVTTLFIILSSVAINFAWFSPWGVTAVGAVLFWVIVVGFIVLKIISSEAKNHEKIAWESSQKGNQLLNQQKQLQLQFQSKNQDLSQRLNRSSLQINQLLASLDGTTDGIIILDTSRKVLFLNRNAQILTETKPLESFGKDFDEVFKFYRQKDLLNGFDICPNILDLKDERLVLDEHALKIVTKSGKENLINLTSHVTQEAHRVNIGVILTLHDLSKDKDIENMKSDFVSMAAHELRTPITSIHGYLDVFLKENQDKLTPDGRDLLSKVAIATQQLQGLVENLLAVSKIERGALRTNMERVDYLTTVKQIVDEINVRARDKNIKLTLELPKMDSISIEADKVRIGEVVMNLLSNAINYTPANGSIKVWMETDADSVTTHIQDSGQGIPKEAIPHLFGKFFRVVQKLGQESKSNGLGLYITKSIIDLHHGRIWVDSEVGKGSTFSFTIPFKQGYLGTLGSFNQFAHS